MSLASEFAVHMTTRKSLVLPLALSLLFSSAAINPALSIGAKKAPAASEGEQEKMEIRDKWAIVVGVNRFADSSIPAQKLGQKSSGDVARALKDPDSGHFGLDHVLVVNGADASKAGIEQAFNEWLFKKALPDDLVVIYINSRLLKNAAGDVFVAAQDSKAQDPDGTAVNLLELLKTARQRIGSTHILCMLDTSPVAISADKPAHDVKWLATNSGLTVLSAAELYKPSTDDQTNLQTLFVHYFVEALKSGGGNFPLAMTAEYVFQKVQEITKGVAVQVPVLAPPSDKSQTITIPIGIMVRSSLPHSVAIGHPVDNLGMNRPDIVAPTLSPTKTAVKMVSRNAQGAAAVKPTAAKTPPAQQGPKPIDEDDEDFNPNLDLRPYVAKMKQDIQKRWSVPKGFESRQVTTSFSINKDGRITNAEIVTSSGNEDVDKSALAALQAPVDPLPKGSPSYVDIKYVFDWKSQPVSNAK